MSPWLQIVECLFAACRSSGNEGAVNIECSKSVWARSQHAQSTDSHNAQPESSALRSVSLLHFCLAVRSNSGTDTLRSVVHAALFAFTHFPVWLIWKVCGGRPRSVLRAGCPKRVRIDLILLHVGASIEVVRYIEMNEANETDIRLQTRCLCVIQFVSDLRSESTRMWGSRRETPEWIESDNEEEGSCAIHFCKDHSTIDS
ncbi:hypothetical protein BLNAU_22817 [Blattamonas nauphoetae]|uniref:Uncharacterized protein n=1 Tax=Blattamonas nauphoetae TaxID=2049346 RepID=A0ABQ9WRX3_9EUKA|nr:hypothetical protein BLNAU_22817 [Blattamonas nauphoetae]